MPDMPESKAAKPSFIKSFFSPKNKRVVFSLIFFVVWAGYATFVLDFIFYSQRAGMSNTEIGLLNAGVGLTGIIMQPLAGFICDYLRTTRRVVMALLCFGIVFSFLFPLASGSKQAVCAVVIGYTVFMCSFMPLLDNWVARECIGETRYHYGSIRWLGSLSYATTAFCYSLLSLTPRLHIAYYIRSGLLLLTLALIFLYKHENIAVKPSRAKSDGGTPGGDKPRIKELFTSKEYLLLVLFMFLFTLAFNSASNFFPALALARGGSNSALGLAGSMTSLIEIPFLLFSRKLTNRFGPRGMMLMGACCVALRLVGFAFMQSMGGLVFAYLLVAPYVGLFNTGFIYYVYSIAPPKTETLAQTTIQAFSSGLAVMLGNFLGGYVIDSLGIDMLYNSALGVIALSLLIFVATSYWLKHRKY